MARARVYRHGLRYAHCGSTLRQAQDDLKNRHSLGKQTYRCRDCQHRFTPDGNRHYFADAIKRRSMDIRAIAFQTNPKMWYGLRS